MISFELYVYMLINNVYMFINNVYMFISNVHMFINKYLPARYRFLAGRWNSTLPDIFLPHICQDIYVLGKHIFDTPAQYNW